MSGASGAARYVAMDGVRGAAALCVVVYHVTHLQGLPGAAICVDLFFGLSGFVLAGAYGRALDEGLGALAFLKLRFARLYPMYAIGLALGGVAHVLALRGGAPVTGGAAAAAIGLNNLLMLPTLLPSQFGVDGSFSINAPFPFDPPGWSLFFELVANVAFACFRPRGRWAWLFVAALGLAFLGAVAAVGHPAGWGVASLWGGVPRALFGFYLGGLLRELADGGRLPRWRLPLVAPALAVAMAWAPFGTSNPAFLVSAMVVAPAVLVAALRDGDTPMLNRLYAEFGRLSYPLYILHVPAYRLFLLGRAWVSPDAGDLSRAEIVGFVGAVALASWLAAVFVEGPARRLMAHAVAGQSLGRSRLSSATARSN